MKETITYKRYFEKPWKKDLVPKGWVLACAIPDEIDCHAVYKLIDDWLTNNSKGKWCAKYVRNGEASRIIKLYVENENDAVLFKLSCL